jgi:predicted phosphodiesterase
MVTRKKPEGVSWADFLEVWHNSDHAEKVKLANTYEATYDTAKHWVSESGEGKKVVPKVELPTVEPLPSTKPIRIDLGTKDVTIAVINDLHIPFHDPEIIEAVEEFLEKIQPDSLFYNGDMMDFYQISDFEKDPSRVPLMQKEVDLVTQMLDRHEELMPNTKRWFITGNHERRLQRFLWTRATALSSLRCLTLDSLFGLRGRGISLVDFEQGVIINDSFLILHGDITSINSGYTAKRLYEKHGGCGMAGHCHRAGSYYKRDRFGTWGWWENGCLCNLNPDWIQNPNWTQGFSLIHFKGDRFWVEQIPIVNGTFLYGGTMYGRKGE